MRLSFSRWLFLVMQVLALAYVAVGIASYFLWLLYEGGVLVPLPTPWLDVWGGGFPFWLVPASPVALAMLILCATWGRRRVQSTSRKTIVLAVNTTAAAVVFLACLGWLLLYLWPYTIL